MGRWAPALFAAFLVIVAGASQEARADRRVALVIGNAAYGQAPTLKNPANDAADLARSLRDLGFEVIEGHDLTHLDMLASVRRFTEALRGADAGLFFYAGHGLQVGGENFLIPVDAKLKLESDLDFEAIRLNLILRQMEREAKTNLIFLDACRDNPLTHRLAQSMGTRSTAVGQGLAHVQSGIGTYIAFATQPGNVALDGQGRNSPFTSALLQHIDDGGKDLGGIMIAVRNDVIAATNGGQVPWEHHALTGQFFFRPSQPAAAIASPQPAAKERSGGQVASLTPSNQPDPTGADVVNDCDLLAASGGDPEAVASGVGFSEMDGPRALVACEQAVAKFPDVRRFRYQLARAADASGQDERARTLYAALVDSNHAEAINNLGAMYANAEGGPRNRAEAARLYRKAAELGDHMAMNNLGWFEVRGIGTEKNVQDGLRHLRAAADNGIARAMANLGILYEHGEGVAQSDAEAFRLYSAAAEQDFPLALNNLGVFYEDGRGTKRDHKEAARLYRKAADLGHTLAASNLGHLYECGCGVPKNPAEAFKYYRQAAEGGSARGMHNLGWAYAKGIGVKADPDEGARWVAEALVRGDAFSAGKMKTNSSNWGLAFRRALQAQLKAKGLYKGPIDGSFGAGTVAAIDAALARGSEDE